MSKIFGPYNRDSWNTMLLLKASINGMKERDGIKLSVPIQKETKILKAYINNVA